MPHTQRAQYTVIGTAPHLQAGDSATRPVSILHNHGMSNAPAELRLTAAEARELAAALLHHADETEPPRAEPDPDDEDSCSNPGGHEWACSGTAYGGDDERWHGEGRSYCLHCGADGDA